MFSGMEMSDSLYDKKDILIILIKKKKNEAGLMKYKVVTLPSHCSSHHERISTDQQRTTVIELFLRSAVRTPVDRSAIEPFIVH